ncbi:hypothetical protein CBR_g51458 [Chara braunii]|uniref:DDE Tnp4 domain-containing protein n=1 Tax=Chara braunii TaxID=69332 RepID=A0A388K6C7_CHABU|nr:hypothetical protein CBR_g51458 [Chara braunii]|eukprot:GBG65576.1 hypothetical protein CBR_g51458 [Chara braunii]
MEGCDGGGRAVLSPTERTAVAAAAIAVVRRYEVERAAGRMKAALSRRRHRLLLQRVLDAPNCITTSEAVVQLCAAIGSDVLPWATPRWWMRRGTGGTWEDLRVCDDATDDYFRKKLRMSRRVFMEITEACAPHLQRQVTFYREPLQPDQIVAYALYRWATGESYDNSTSSFGIGRASGVRAVRDVTAALFRVYGDKISWPMGLPSLSKRAKEGTLFRGPPVTLPGGVRTNGYILGDNGYPPSEWIVVPYGGINQHPNEERFDNKQKVARGVVERAFGRLKGMWRLFLRSHKTNLDTLPQQFTAVCILHNILLDAGIEFDENLLWEVDENGVRRRVDLGARLELRMLCQCRTYWSSGVKPPLSPQPRSDRGGFTPLLQYLLWEVNENGEFAFGTIQVFLFPMETYERELLEAEEGASCSSPSASSSSDESFCIESVTKSRAGRSSSGARGKKDKDVTVEKAQKRVSRERKSLAPTKTGSENKQLSEEEELFYEEALSLAKESGLSSWKLSHCKAFLKKHGGTVSGKKADLLSKIEQICREGGGGRVPRGRREEGGGRREVMADREGGRRSGRREEEGRVPRLRREEGGGRREKGSYGGQGGREAIWQEGGGTGATSKEGGGRKGRGDMVAREGGDLAGGRREDYGRKEEGGTLAGGRRKAMV